MRLDTTLLYGCLQADSNCQLAVTSSTAVEEATDGGDDVTWLKWTGAAVLFVEALIVSAATMACLSMQLHCAGILQASHQ